MTTYKYELEADQKTSGYGGYWLELNRQIEVFASNYAEATRKALDALPTPRRDTNGWVFTTKKITEIPEPDVATEEIHFEPREIRKKFRMKGAH